MSAVAGRTPVHVGGLSDEELVRLARAGTKQAFDAIVHRYRAPLVSYCRRWLDAHRAEEVVQHTLMKAFLCVRDDDRPLALRPWLYRVAHNAALNAVEKKGSDWEELDENYDGVPQPPQVAEQRARFLKVVGGDRGASRAPARGAAAQRVRGPLLRGHRRCSSARPSRASAACFAARATSCARPLPRCSCPCPSCASSCARTAAAARASCSGPPERPAASARRVASRRSRPGVLAAGTIAGGGTAIQHSDDPLKAPDAKAADDAPPRTRRRTTAAERSVLVAAPSEEAGPYAVEPESPPAVRTSSPARAARRGRAGGGADGWVGGFETDAPRAERASATTPEEPLLPDRRRCPDHAGGEEEEQPTAETGGSRRPPADGSRRRVRSSRTRLGGAERRGAAGPERAREGSEPGALRPRRCRS